MCLVSILRTSLIKSFQSSHPVSFGWVIVVLQLCAVFSARCIVLRSDLFALCNSGDSNILSCTSRSSYFFLDYVVYYWFRFLFIPWNSCPCACFYLVEIVDSCGSSRARFLSLARSKLRLCPAKHRPGYWSNLPCEFILSKRQKTGPEFLSRRLGLMTVSGIWIYVASDRMER